MWDIPRLVMATSGLVLVLIGLKTGKAWEAGYGACIFGSALFGWLARSNPVYDWFQAPFAVGMLVLAATKFTRMNHPSRIPRR